MTNRFYAVCLGTFALALSWLALPRLAAQTVTGSVSGSVTDSSGGAVSGAAVNLVSEAAGISRQASSDGLGKFAFNGVPPGRYSLLVEHAGFKKYERHQVNLSANERLSLGTVVLDVGALTESVTVTAQGATVQTASGERSGLVSSTQVESLNVLTRDFASLLSLMPGVVTDDRSEAMGDGININVQGSRITGNYTGVDRVSMNNLGNHGRPQAFVSMDAISEVKILTTNFQAEFGSRAGAMVQAVTKSGTRDFHGQLYWYKRHEQLNANSFFNNRNGVPEAPYRYTTAGFNVGGPLILPGKFNQDRNKLFFFFSSEHIRSAQPQSIRTITTPTERERRGDFSDSRDLNGALIAVRDPVSGQPFPGNVVPASRIHRLGQGYLGLLPLPNALDIAITGRRYNYQVQESIESPRHAETVRTDYQPRPSTTLYGRFNNWFLDQRGYAVTAGNSNWGWLPSTFCDFNQAAILSLNHTVSPTLVLEAFMSAWDSDETGGDTMFTWSATLSKAYASHMIKFGLSADRLRNYEGVDGDFTGTFNFGRDVNNPNDSNHPFANALLGNVASYTESTTRPWVQGRATLIEWFTQDNWRVTRKLTLDYGLRFSWAQPYYHYRREEAGFVLERLDPARQVRLIEPARVGARRLGRRPVTGETLPAAAIGAIAAGSGDPYNGIVNTLVNKDYPRGLRDTSGLKLSPRFGFALDPFGRGRTAIRGGFGMFRELRDTGGRRFGLWSNPPLREDPIIYTAVSIL